ncbi:hypothetical protein FA002_23960 [Priestia megaterium]|uniref:DUF6414 family protein n=1 Tax=Priestia megaterium TaxID=1404 RepID=UPI0010ACE98D|nr:DUF6414 family protein [Priestia megaterium]TJZ32235.1 hypothetical protein FA002_23960 [Priestia megaterium]
MKKVIYFDESSALDILDIKNSGRSEEIMETMVKKANKFSLDGKIGTGVLDFLNLGPSINSKGGVSRNKSNILTTNLTNTILTSFLSLIENKESKSYGLEELKDYKLTILPDSAAFIKSIAPFIKVFKSSEEISEPSDPFSMNNIDLQSFDEVLLNAKGYYELVAINNEDAKKIVRFNLDGFRNNYKLHDLQKMNLTLYGVEVGNCLEENLSFDKEVGGINYNSKEDEETSLGYNPHDEKETKDECSENEELVIIDIILAGVKK